MNIKKLVYPMSIKKLSDNDYLVTSPVKELDIISHAESFENAIELGKESIEFTLFDIYDSKEDLPIVLEDDLLTYEKNKSEDEIITYITTDIEAILNKFSDQSQKIMVSIPRYQNYWLKKNKVRASALFQDAISKEMVKNQFR